jgi:hypothetical protein
MGLLVGLALKDLSSDRWIVLGFFRGPGKKGLNISNDISKEKSYPQYCRHDRLDQIAAASRVNI